ncbi:hypothetical protein RTP6_7725 [Batrachochytrium dendrobatidis]
MCSHTGLHILTTVNNSSAILLDPSKLSFNKRYTQLLNHEYNCSVEFIVDMVTSSINKCPHCRLAYYRPFAVILTMKVSIRTELEQGGIFESLMAIVQSDTDCNGKRVAGQIIETCFQHRVHVANSSIQPYDNNAEIDMKSGMAGYVHGDARTLVEMRYIQYMQCILCKPMWWIDITNQHIVEQWRADSLDRNISPSTFNLALEQLGFLSNSLFVMAVMDLVQLSQDLLN